MTDLRSSHSSDVQDPLTDRGESAFPVSHDKTDEKPPWTRTLDRQCSLLCRQALWCKRI
ncbi:hypothetical protein J6590_063843 [Homalodisca vitripennis]|nr:hypothetical protein J6590_063843 [Homalodisca vitripennis]